MVTNPDIWEGTVLTVPNRHVKDCGQPPEIVAGRMYTAYFENCYGEQLVFTYDSFKKEGALYHGDCGWDQPIQVINGIATDTILSEEERIWLQLVWKVATGAPVKTSEIDQGGNGSKIV